MIHVRAAVERNTKSVMEHKTLEQRIEKIETRNKRVEQDKSWERSYFRRISVALMTYIVIVVFFYITKTPKPFLSALVPCIGYILSTVALSQLRKYWEDNTQHGK